MLIVLSCCMAESSFGMLNFEGLQVYNLTGTFEMRSLGHELGLLLLMLQFETHAGLTCQTPNYSREAISGAVACCSFGEEFTAGSQHGREAALEDRAGQPAAKEALGVLSALRHVPLSLPASVLM